MLNRKLRKWESYFTDPNPGLKAYFGRVRKGQPDHYTTNWYGDTPLPKILKRWMVELSTIKDEWPGLYQFEIDLSAKVGPMSIMKPLSDRLPDIESYYEGVLLPTEPISEEAIRSVCKEWGAASGLQLRSQRSTWDNMRKSTNSGSPYFAKRKTLEREYSKHQLSYYHDSLESISRIDGREWLNAAVLGWRGQEGGPDPSDVKQRVVWMFPLGVNLEELRVYQPLIEAAQKSNLVPAWVSMDAVDYEITQLFKSKGEEDLIVCTDFTRFDQHFGPSCQECAEKLLRHLLNNTPVSTDWLINVFPIKYSIPLAYDYGKIKRGRHGMASGSGGTNADETLVHRALQYAAAHSCRSELNPHSMCLGDDGILTYPGITVDSVVSEYSKHGLEMNPDKQSASTSECVYLRRWHHKDYVVDGINVGVYSTCRAIGRLRETERSQRREDWTPEMTALRELSILENCKYHPLKEQFVKFVMKGSQSRLGLDIPGFYDRLDSIVKEAMDQHPDALGYVKTLQFGDNDTSISDWWIVKYLRTFRRSR